MNPNEARRRTNTILGVLLVSMGGLFLVSQIFDISLWRFAWPFFIIIPGVLFFVGMVAGGRPAGPLAIPGSIVTMTGLILLYQSITGAWASWAYVWALIFPTSIGIGLIINGRWSDTPAVVRTGTSWTIAGLIIFLVTGGIFELVFNISQSRVNEVLWPLLLIGVGIWMLRRRSLHPSTPAGAESPWEVPQRPEPPTPPAPPAPPAAPPVPPIERTRPTNGPQPPEFEPLDPTRGRKG